MWMSVMPLSYRRKSDRLRSKKRMQAARDLGCCICKNPVADAHHLRTVGHRRAASLKNGDDYTIPLCRKHHDELHMFGDEKLFLALHGVDVVEILRQLNGGQDD
jgi:hypothetical protein